MLNAHMAFDSDCFSHAIVRTRLYLPDCTRLAATIAVEPPTDPAVCTRINGLFVAPVASAMNSSGIMTPSKKSGALPTTTASMSSNVEPESASARSMASRTRPFIDTSCRLATYFVCPVPSTAASCPATILFPSRTATRFCCSAGPLVACARTRCAEPSKMCCAAKPMRSSPAENIGLAARAPPDGLTFVDEPSPIASVRISC